MEGSSSLEGGGLQVEWCFYWAKGDMSSIEVITSLIRRSLATISRSHSSSLFSHIFFASSLKERGRIISEVNPPVDFTGTDKL